MDSKTAFAAILNVFLMFSGSQKRFIFHPFLEDFCLVFVEEMRDFWPVILEPRAGHPDPAGEHVQVSVKFAAV
jgi:hypothetical protein